VDAKGSRKAKLSLSVDEIDRMDTQEETLWPTMGHRNQLIKDELLQGCTGNMCNALVEYDLHMHEDVIVTIKVRRYETTRKRVFSCIKKVTCSL